MKKKAFTFEIMFNQFGLRQKVATHLQRRRHRRAHTILFSHMTEISPQGEKFRLKFFSTELIFKRKPIYKCTYILTFDC
jgi:hypothetical protein